MNVKSASTEQKRHNGLMGLVRESFLALLSREFIPTVPLRRTIPLSLCHPARPDCLLIASSLLLILASWCSASDRYDELAQLVNQFPHRQVGQAGNDAISLQIQQRFEAAVEQANANQTDRWEQGQRLRSDAQEAHRRVLAAKEKLEIATQVGATKDSPWYVRFTLENPAPTASVFALLLVSSVLAWRLQRRSSLLVAAIGCGVIVVLVALVATLIETEAERIARRAATGELVDPSQLTTQVLEAEVRDRALAALGADQKAAEALRSLWQYGQIKFSAAVFVPGRTTLHVGSLQVPLYQMAPNLIEPANLPARGFDGRLIYGGTATSPELAPIDAQLSGAAVLLEFNCARRWLVPIRRRAKLIVFIEPPADAVATYNQAGQKYSDAPLSIPRFYLKRRDLRSAFGPEWKQRLLTGDTVRISQLETGRWKRQTQIDHWLFIPPVAKPPVNNESQGDLERQLVHLQTYLDSNSIVPALSPGTNSAGNLILTMRLVDRFLQKPPSRPVLISVVNHHANAFQGEEEFAYAALADAEAPQAHLEWLEQQLAQKNFEYATFSQEPNLRVLEHLRFAVVTVAGKQVKAKQPIQDQLMLLRNRGRWSKDKLEVRRKGVGESSNNQLSPQQAVERSSIEKHLKRIDRESNQLVRLMRLFSRFGQDKLSFDQLGVDERQRLQEIFDQLTDQAEQSIDQLRENRTQLLENLSIRQRLRFLIDAEALPIEPTFDQVFAEQYRPLPSTVGICLDLSFNTDAVGFFYTGHVPGPYIQEAKKRTPALARYTVRVARQFAAETGQENLLTDTLSLRRGLPWKAYVGGRFGMASRIMNEHAVAALTLTSVQDARPYTFSPFDRVDRIDRTRFNRVLGFAEGYLAMLIDAAELARQPIRVKEPAPFAVDLSVRKYDRSSSDVPKQTVPGALVVVPTGWSATSFPQDFALWGQVRPHMVMMTDKHGAAILRGARYRSINPLAFQYDPAFRKVTASLDQGAGSSKGAQSMSSIRRTRFVEGKIVVYPFHKVDLLGLTTPLTLAPSEAVRIIDARQGSTARHFGIVGIGAQSAHSPTQPLVRAPVSRDGTAAIFVEPGTFFQLQIQNAVAINTQGVGTETKGGGYPAQVGQLHDVLAETFRDMTSLTDQRLDRLEERGVTSQAASDTNRQARQAVEQRFSDHISPIEHGAGLAYRAFNQSRSIVNDLVNAVVIFLALIIPFCFFIMKLITPFTDMNRQIVLFCGVFVAMVVVLYFVHPAFAIADAPIVVVLAFVILALAGLVSMVLIGRFNASMNQLIEQVLQSQSSDAPQSHLLEVAFMVGVNNMKRRRIRTTLTCATVVLVTFTMLSVISVGQDLDPVMIKEGSKASYDGFVLTRPGMDRIPPLQVERLRARFSDASVAVRVWAARHNELGAHLPFKIRPVSGARADAPPAAKTLNCSVVFGLDRVEDGFIQPMPLAAGRWFSTNDAAEIVLSVEAAKLLGITADSFDEPMLSLFGIQLKLVGLLDDDTIKKIRDLSDSPMLPLRFDVFQNAAGRSRGNQANQVNRGDESLGTATLSGTEWQLPGTDPFDPVHIAFVPIEVALASGYGDYRMLSVKFGGSHEASAAQRTWDQANEMVRFQHVRLAVGLTEAVQRAGSASRLPAGEYALTSSTSTQLGGVLKAAIPILLAATIIFNTMLGSVMERKREVGIYNAIGLNPGHVMIFFLAESLVFGIVGSVLGYLIGQVVSIVITRFQLVDLNLNYSSLAVVIVIFLTVLTVLISTIYPAMMAARAAVPSGQRRWSLPRPEGDQIKVDFPFSYDAGRVLGVCAYLYDFMEQNSEASTGKFLSQNAHVGFVPIDHEGEVEHPVETSKQPSARSKAYAMVFDVAPAPFDLGVNQKMEVYACYRPKVRAHMLTVHLMHISGQPTDWVTVNQPFLEALRKRLLVWRSQPEHIEKSYFERGQQLFARATDLPVVDPNESGLRERFR